MQGPTVGTPGRQRTQVIHRCSPRQSQGSPLQSPETRFLHRTLQCTSARWQALRGCPETCPTREPGRCLPCCQSATNHPSWPGRPVLKGSWWSAPLAQGARLPSSKLPFRVPGPSSASDPWAEGGGCRTPQHRQRSRVPAHERPQRVIDGCFHARVIAVQVRGGMQTRNMRCGHSKSWRANRHAS